jgi:hypothetical protein
VKLDDRSAVLVFSKTTRFRHGEAIDASKAAFSEIVDQRNWSLYKTEERGVFNREQLAKFNGVIFNNSIGRLCTMSNRKR